MPVLPVSVPAQVVSAPLLPPPTGLHLAPPLGSRPSPAATWTHTDTALEAVFWTTFAVDWLQTLEVARHPYWCISTPCIQGVLPDGSPVVVPAREDRFDRFSERNPLLGRHPSVRRVNAYFLATGLTYYLVTRKLSTRWRRAVTLTAISLEVITVNGNIQAGIRIR
ncbi:MAG: hypothetical protein NTW40_00325 [Acidobacteria bacterium]|nr:hypothetical protein [Acidobacteriota bacterium]